MALYTASVLNEDWRLHPRERPDFLVETPAEKFALEVTEVIAGPITKKGASARQVERANQKWLDSIRQTYESLSSAKLHLRYSGTATQRAEREIVQRLLSENFASKPLLYRLKQTLSDGKIWVTNEFASRWVFLKDRVGWVSHDPTFLDRSIEHKAKKLAAYRRLHDDVRLLVYADRGLNSGKISLEHLTDIQMHGFNGIYFLSYPAEVSHFDGTSCRVARAGGRRTK
ncbi:MAG: hypothetical protein ABR601_08935 [Parasphingopyxis sp.]